MTFPILLDLTFLIWTLQKEFQNAISISGFDTNYTKL